MGIHTSLLQQFPLLRHLPPDTLARLAEQSSLRSYARREVVLQKDSSVECVHFLLEGRLQATDFTLDGREVGLYFVEEGHYCGEIAMLDGMPYPEVIIANKKSQVVQVPNRLMQPLMLEHPQMMRSLTMGLARRVREQSEQRQILSINNPLQRVSAQIVMLVRRQQDGSTSPNHGSQQLTTPPTHQELAMMLNLSRETVTRVFQVLQARKVLDRQAESLKIDSKKIDELARNPDQAS